jgi:hypothetical protein
VKQSPDPHYRHRFPAEFISHALWLYGSVRSRPRGGPDGEPGRLQVGSDPLRVDREPGMECFESAAVTERRDRTAQGYRRFRSPAALLTRLI